jgi:hypothetical protein
MTTRKTDKLRLTQHASTDSDALMDELGNDNRGYVAALTKIVRLAHHGAMLGHDHAYDACLNIETLASAALPTIQPKTAPRKSMRARLPADKIGRRVNRKPIPKRPPAASS